ncbi:ectoine/hydroxyectoine ABC transporter substrate-binding protein EhuB [Cupriavidus pinatubonensis]|uniref:ectoine/hydroxyectoine ABC transporter substrate-binding protein EhuB n=1 Tax=Cupriavidus pinatubonensis TaxID=248026 RepID=UPI001CC75B39|nr:ectoine/hydroxyectoine ABC transporter substrate-binding protein EhuB [Cupriavidus pinatubonensis]
MHLTRLLGQPYLLAALLVGLVTGAFASFVLDTGSEDTLARYQRGQPLRVGYAIEQPFAMVEADGRVTGEAPEVLRYALRSLGKGDVVWLHADFGSLIHELESGRIDVIAAGMFITPARAQRVLFTRPTASISPGLLVRHGNPLHLHSLKDVVSRPMARLAVIDGSVEQQLAREAGKSEARIQAYPDATAAAAAVSSGLADALMLSSMSLQYLVATGGKGVFELIDATTAREEFPAGLPAFAMRAEDVRLRDAIDEALAEFLGSAAHLELVRPFGILPENLAPTSGKPKQ